MITFNSHAAAFITGLCCLFAVAGYMIAGRKNRRKIRGFEERLDYLSRAVYSARYGTETREEPRHEDRYDTDTVDALKRKIGDEDTQTIAIFEEMLSEPPPQVSVITDATTGSQPVVDDWGRVRVHARTTDPLRSNGGRFAELSDDRVTGTVVATMERPGGEPYAFQPGVDPEEALQARVMTGAEADFDALARIQPGDDPATMAAKLAREHFGQDYGQLALTGASR